MACGSCARRSDHPQPGRDDGRPSDDSLPARPRRHRRDRRPLPAALAVSPDGAHVYVANRDSGDISIFDTATTTFGATVTTGGTGPQGIAVSPDGVHVYVTNANSGDLSVLDTVTGHMAAPVSTGGSDPLGLAVSPDGAHV
ncbi:YncE family protein [Subtercola sp. YIM 133946]|uniref:YncE family protein n=1 Tax=Subtercola sp. YIM 133946 TaxID=3118909 RepID=UPI002F939404